MLNILKLSFNVTHMCDFFIYVNVSDILNNKDDQWSDDAWQWKVDYEEIEESSKTTENWMQGCFVCCSPHFEVFVLAHEDRWAVLTCMLFLSSNKM